MIYIEQKLKGYDKGKCTKVVKGYKVGYAMLVISTGTHLHSNGKVKIVKKSANRCSCGKQ